MAPCTVLFAALPFTVLPFTAAAEEPRRVRSLVRVRVIGPAKQEHASTLYALVESELTDARVTLSVDTDDETLGRWLTRGQRESRTLLLAVLDTRRQDYWQITIVDAARRRAIKRQLPGGVAENAAALEAVASILVSAVTALQDGLEVASQPVEDVLPDAGPREEGALGGRGARESSQNSSAGSAEAIASVPVVPRFVLVGTAVSLAEQQRATLGAGVACGLTFSSGVNLRILATRFRSATFRTEFGDFRTTRSQVGLGAGYALAWRRFQLEPEIRLLLDLNRRHTGDAVEGATARQSATLSRTAGGAGVRGLYLPWPEVGFEGLVGAAYAPRRVSFVTTPNAYEIARLWPWLLTVELGVQFNLQ